MSLIKLASIEKTAIEPISLGIGLLKGFQTLKHYGGMAIGAMTGANLHNVDKLALAPKHTWSQRALLTDSLIALKRGTEGKVLATRKPMTMLAFSDSEAHMKLLGEHHINTLGQQIPFGNKLLFDNSNKFNTGRFKKILESSGDFKDGIRADTAKRVVKTTKNVYARHRMAGMSEPEALLRSQIFSQKLSNRLGEKTYPAMQNLDLANKYHKMLSANNGHGYAALEKAAPEAQRVMNRPGLINYSKHMYATPEINRESIGKYIARPMQFFSGQNPQKRGFLSFMRHGTGEALTPIHKVTEKAEGTTLKHLQTMANENKIDQTIKPEHIANFADKLPSIRQDMLAQTNSFVKRTKNKIFNR